MRFAKSPSVATQTMHCLPTFSIIVPTHNRPEQLAECLAALRRLSYPSSCFEVIVVDDGSQASVADIVHRYSELKVKLIVQAQAGPAAARNNAAAQSQAEFLAFTDDDCQPDSGWLQCLSAQLDAHPQAAVGGRCVNALTGNTYSTASHLLLDFIYNHYNAVPDDAKFFASNNFACRAKSFREMGGFDTSFPLAAAEDRELCDRWRLLGGRLVYAPQAIIKHYHAMNLRSFFRQHFNYGRGAFHFHTLRQQRSQLPLRREPWSFYWSLMLSPRRRCTKCMRLIGLMFLSQVANATGYFYARLLPKKIAR